MPQKNTNSVLLTELIDHLLYETEENKKLKERLRRPISDKFAIPGHLGVIVREGIAAGVSKDLAHAVILQYAESESVDLTAEQIAEVVDSSYRRASEKASSAAGIKPPSK